LIIIYVKLIFLINEKLLRILPLNCFVRLSQVKAHKHDFLL